MTDATLEAIDAAIVGGGVVGLAAACAVAARGRTACVIERRLLSRVGNLPSDCT